MMQPAAFGIHILFSAVVLLSVAAHGSAISNRAPPTCHLGARADLAGGQLLEHATQIVDLNNTATCSGTLTSWRYCHYPITGAVSFQVWRRRGALQLDLVRSQSFRIVSSEGHKDHLTCETYSLSKSEYVGVLARDILGIYVEHPHDEVTAVHVSKRSHGLSRLYQLAAMTEPNVIEISTLSILNRAVLHLSADIQSDILIDSSAPPLHLIQRDVLHDVHAQGFDSPQNAGLSRYIYSYWRVLTTVLAPLVVLSVVTIGVLCCKSQSHPGKKRTAIDETPLSKNSEQIDNWVQLKVVPVASSNTAGSKPTCIDLSKDTPLQGNSRNCDGDPLVPVTSGGGGGGGRESPEVYELPVSAGVSAHTPLLYEAPVLAEAEQDPLTYEVPASEGTEPMGLKSEERTHPTSMPGGETSQSVGASGDTFPPLHLMAMPGRDGEIGALNRISCTQEACASSEMELICQLAREEVIFMCATDIQVLFEIGRGLFGSVHKALWHAPQKKPQEVTTIGLGTQKDRITLMQTAVTMGRLKHPNVVTTIGIMAEPEHVCIVTEHCSNGSLLSYLFTLRKRDGVRSVSSMQRLQTFAQHIAHGMIYLSDKGIIHCSLAAKNVFVTASNTCKIGGIENVRLARYDGIVDDSLVNWMPLEVLRSSLYSTPSDVWSFGCLLYELWTLGEIPFKGCSPSEVASMLSVGHRLPPPPGCSRKMYKLMITTWHPSASSRPTFRDILPQLEAKDEQTSPLSPEFPDLQSVGEGDSAKVYDRLYRDLQFLYLQQQEEDDYSECEDNTTPFIDDFHGTNPRNPPAHTSFAENEFNTSLTYDRLEDKTTPPSGAKFPHVAITVTEDPTHSSTSSMPFRAHPSKDAPPPLPFAPPPRHHSAPDISSSGASTRANIVGITSSSGLIGRVPGEQLDVDYDEICSDTVSNVEDSVLEESIYDHLLVDKCEDAHKLHGVFTTPYFHSSPSGYCGLMNNIAITQSNTSDVQTIVPSSMNSISGVQSSTLDHQNSCSGLNLIPQSRVPSCSSAPHTVNSQSSTAGPENTTLMPRNTTPTPQNTTPTSQNTTQNISPTPKNTTSTPQNTTPGFLNNFQNTTTAPFSAHQPLVTDVQCSKCSDPIGEDSAQMAPLTPVTDPALIPLVTWQYNTMPVRLPNPPLPFHQPTAVELDDDYDEVVSDSSSSPTTPLSAAQPSPKLCGPPTTFPTPASLYPNVSDFEEDYDEIVGCNPTVPIQGHQKSSQPPVVFSSQSHSKQIEPWSGSWGVLLNAPHLPQQPHPQQLCIPVEERLHPVATPTQPCRSPVSSSLSNSNHVAMVTNLAQSSSQQSLVDSTHTMRSPVDSDSDVDYDHLT